MIALAIESSNSRGMGHLFRSLLIVEYLNKHDIPFIYLINDDEKSKEILRSKSIPFLIVDYKDTTSNWENNIIDNYSINIWVNDKYETSLEMSGHIKDAGAYLALIDDIGSGEKIADIIFVGLVYFSKQTYFCKNTRIGLKYVILNEEVDTYKRIRKKLNKIIVTLGGSDPFDNTRKIVKELLKTNFEFDVLIGPNYKFEEEIRKLCCQRFKILKNVPSLIELFNKYDVAITGGGVTCCEANASGLPCVIVANAPHEVNTARFLSSEGSSIFAGDHNSIDFSFIEKISSLDLEKMSKKGMRLFDTKAIERIFNEIAK